MQQPATSEILSALNQLDQRDRNRFCEDLCDRKRAELEHADKLRDVKSISEVSQDTFEALKGNNKFYKTVEKSRAYEAEWIAKNCKDKIVLDYACGNGTNAMAAAQAGAALAIGMDISPISIENCKQEAKRRGLNNTYFVQGDCENTGLPNDSMDTVLCSGMLHHLDLSFALPELRRFMKPGGKCLAIEALDYNPMIKLYRTLTPQMRTEWEKAHILSLKDVRFAQRFFEIDEVKYWHLFSIGATPFHRTKLMKVALSIGNALDAVAMKIPYFQRLAWMFTFTMTKPQAK